MRSSLPVIIFFFIHLTHAIWTIFSRNKPTYNHNLGDRDIQTRLGHRDCAPEFIRTRKEWRFLSKPERSNYIEAVLCLQKKPALYKDVIGAKSRFDDFQVEHIKQTFNIHYSAPFTAWHRWFVWTYEQALIKECGYRGAQPYWDWTLDSANLMASPVFDGSPYGLGGNGEFIPDLRGPIFLISLATTVDRIVNWTELESTGGGCVTTGPFANLTVLFGPLGPGLTDSLRNNPDNLKHRPHCLNRNMRPKTASQSFTPAAIEALLGSPDIHTFNQRLSSLPDSTEMNNFDLHGKGHLSTGGDVANIFSSPGDPAFYFHHAQIDRLWTMWQKRDPATRQYAISGTGTLGNTPPSPSFRLDDTITMGKLSSAGPQPIQDFLNTKGGPFCYEYV